MTAAIYARKSTDQNVADEQNSVTRQIDHAREYARAKGWTVLDQHVYVDDGISGAEFAKRPGFVRLMNALTPRPPFHVLVMSEESRLGREGIETAYALKQLISAGVRVFFYLEDRERTLDSPIEKVMLSIPLQRRLLYVTDPGFDLPFAIRIADPTRQRDRAVLGEDVAVERIEAGVVDVRREHAFLQIVEDDDARGAAESTKRTLVQLGPDLRARPSHQQAH